MSVSTTTGTVRLSYVNILKPFAFKPGQTPKYSTTLLIPKDDTETYNNIMSAIDEATQLGADTKWGGQIPPKVATPIHDGDGTRPSDGAAYGPECKGHWVMTASANEDYPPEVVDANIQPILSPSEVYSGMYARVHISFFPYNFSGRKGIGCSLGPIQKIADGEPLSGGPTASSVFQKAGNGTINPITGQTM